VGDKIGKVHLGRQDLSVLQTRKMKGLKRSAVDDDKNEQTDDGMDIDEISEDEELYKKPRLA
jgi:ribosome production factor 2